ncbi:MAG: prohead protease/major capsid protein fusion protein [Deltaproteobacteria bacterium]
MLKKNGKSTGEDRGERLYYRALTIATKTEGKPATLDEESRSVEVVGATENPVPVYDYERDEVIPEVLLMKGCRLSAPWQVPLLENHNRYSTADVLGSYREMRVEKNELVGLCLFSTVQAAQDPWQKLMEGHLTDFSLGYRVVESTYIPKGESRQIAGKLYEGPLKVATQWMPRELSVTPVGADEMAKARASAGPGLGNQLKKEKEEAMDRKVREFLESRGLAKTANEEEAYRLLETLDVRKKADEPNDQHVRAEAARVEQTRILEIRAMCDMAGCAEEADEFITGYKSTDEARKAVFEKMLAKTPTAGGNGYRPPVEVVKEEREKFRAAAADSILIRAGRKLDKPAPGARDLAGFSLRELAREALRLAGQPVHGDPLAMVGRSLTTSDFPILLANVANKELFEGYESASETWSVWCAVGSVSDFKTHSSARASESDDLDEIMENGEYRYGSMAEAKEQYQIATYGKLFKISRQTIINDDLGAFTDIPWKHGEAASRKIGDIAYAVLTANSAMGDGVALFHANHANLGTGAVPSETTIAEAIKLMGLQKDVNGKRRLNISPQFFIASKALEGSAEIFFNSGQFAGDNKAATRTNPYAGSRFVRAYDSRLDDASSTAWYMAGPKGKTVKVFFLNGNQAPYLEQKEGWNVDGVEYKVRIDAGAKAMDWKALVKNAGA